MRLNKHSAAFAVGVWQFECQIGLWVLLSANPYWQLPRQIWTPVPGLEVKRAVELRLPASWRSSLPLLLEACFFR